MPSPFLCVRLVAGAGATPSTKLNLTRPHSILCDETTNTSLICVSDLSANGFKHNGYHRKGKQSVVLCDGDVISLPGVEHGVAEWIGAVEGLSR
jgi:hypothetical protein